MDVVRIPLADTMRFGGRDVDAATVKLLAESMAAVGQLNPILVRKGERQDGPTRIVTYWIIAGRHRVQAARALGWNEIDAVLTEADTQHAELAEIDENLIRAELGDADRAKAHVRRRQLMKDLGLIHEKPGRPKKGDNLSSYSAEAANTLGVDQKTVKRDLARGENISTEILDQVAGTDLDKGVVLDRLAKEPLERQLTILAEERAKREAEKANKALNRQIALDDAQAFADWLMARIDLNELPQVISWLEGTNKKHVIEALRREAA